MIITCPRCEKRFGVRDELIPPRGRRAKCASCDEVFLAKPAEGVAAQEPAHFEALGMPGDGLASRVSFVAPAAPRSIASQRPGSGGHTFSPVTGGPPVLVSPPPRMSSQPGGSASSSEHETETGGAPDAAALRAGTRWIASDPDGHEALREKRDLIQMIRQRRLSADSTLREEGTGQTVRAGEIPELMFYFQLRSMASRAASPMPADRTDGVAGPMQAQGIETGITGRQDRHPAEDSDPGDTEDGADCRPEDSPGPGGSSDTYQGSFAAAVGWADTPSEWNGDPAVEIDGRPPSTFMRDLPRVLSVPFSGWGLVLMQLYAALAVLTGLNPIFGCLLGLLMLAYTPHLLRQSARGAASLPDWPEGRDLASLAMGCARTLAVTLTAALPLIAFNLLMIGPGAAEQLIPGTSLPALADWLRRDIVAGNLLLVGLFCFYYPMALGLCAAFETIEPAFNPLMTLRAIVTHIAVYVPLVLAIAAGLVAAAAVHLALARTHLLAGTFLGAILWGYVSLAGAYALGRLFQRSTVSAGRAAETPAS